MHSSSVWPEYFYVFKLLWRGVYFLVEVLAKHLGEHVYTRERSVYERGA